MLLYLKECIEAKLQAGCSLHSCASVPRAQGTYSLTLETAGRGGRTGDFGRSLRPESVGVLVCPITYNRRVAQEHVH